MRKAAKKQSTVVELESARTRRVSGHRIGTLRRAPQGLKVDYPDNPHGWLPARTTLPKEAFTDIAAGQTRQALLLFEDERSDRPIVIALLPAQELAPAPAPPAQDITATVDGQRVVLDGRDEIVLRCGEASITLRRNGRVVIRGAYVETRSRGVNRIKGGSVQIN